MTSSEKSCVFPFIYEGNTYEECTTVGDGESAWCATEVNSDGEYTDYGVCRGPCETLFADTFSEHHFGTHFRNKFLGQII